jgi:hypothetical protein
MPLYKMTADVFRPISQTSFTEQKVKERSDLQRLLRTQISVLSDDLYVLSEEFGDWEDSRKRSANNDSFASYDPGTTPWPANDKHSFADTVNNIYKIKIAPSRGSADYAIAKQRFKNSCCLSHCTAVVANGSVFTTQPSECDARSRASKQKAKPQSLPKLPELSRAPIAANRVDCVAT